MFRSTTASAWVGAVSSRRSSAAFLLLVPALLWWRGLTTPAVTGELNLASGSSGATAAFEILEFQFPSTRPSTEFLVLIGCLDDAAVVTPVTIKSVSTPDAASRLRPLEASPRKAAAGIAQPAGRSAIQPVSWSAADTEIDVLRVETFEERRRHFFLQTGSNPGLRTSYQPIQARLAAESPRLRLWLDFAAKTDRSTDELAALVRSLSDDVLPRITRMYGEIHDLDGDGKLSVCLTPALAQLPQTGSVVEGLVQMNDFLDDLPRPFSNHADVMFLSPHLGPGPHATAILAHEAAHLAVFSRRREVDPEGLRPEDDWLNEGLAHCAEIACGGDWSNLQQRIAAFADRPDESPLVVTDAHRQGMWRHPGARGAAWSFFSWLADEYGSEALTELARQPEIGCEKIERVAGEPFPELCRRWSIAVWQTQSRRNRADESSFAQGMRANPARVRVISPVDMRSEVSLRGTSHLACRITPVTPGNDGCRIISPRGRRLQVTVIDEAGNAWIVR